MENGPAEEKREAEELVDIMTSEEQHLGSRYKGSAAMVTCLAIVQPNTGHPHPTSDEEPLSENELVYLPVVPIDDTEPAQEKAELGA